MMVGTSLRCWQDYYGAYFIIQIFNWRQHLPPGLKSAHDFACQCGSQVRILAFLIIYIPEHHANRIREFDFRVSAKASEYDSNDIEAF